MATHSSCEAELSACVQLIKLGLEIRAVAEELVGEAQLELQCDNMAMVQAILTEVTTRC